MLLRCAVSSCKRQYSVSLTLPTRANNIRNQSLIAVTELCLYTVYDTASGRIEVTGASVPTLSAGLLQRYTSRNS